MKRSEQASGRDASEGARQRRAARHDGFDLTPSDEQRMILDAFGDFAESRLRAAASEADAESGAAQALIVEGHELGLSALGVPTALGGAFEERSAVTNVLVGEALAHGDLGLAVALLAPAAVSTAISLWGDAGQQGAYLPSFTGERPPAAALALLEPRALFDPLALSTMARRSGTDFVLDGSKALVPRAAEAELLVIGAELGGSGPALFIVEAPAAGTWLESEPEPAMGVRAAATGRVTLDGLRLPGAALLAQGEAYADCVRLGRLGWCALACGTAKAVLDHLIPYVNERHAFGEPISHRQAVAFTISNIAIEAEGMRLATLRAAGLADRGEALAREVAHARQQCGAKGMQIGSDGVQMLGGHGFTKEHPEERWYRDLRAAALMEGALLV